MQANVIYCPNAFDLSDHELSAITQETTVMAWLEDNGGLARINAAPTVCQFNDDYLLRNDYSRVIKDGDSVAFVTLPQGGEGSGGIFKAAAFFAVSAYTGQWHWSLQFLAQVGSQLVLNKLIPAPELPAYEVPEPPSPTYSLQGQRNANRLGSPIAVWYGKMRIYPDLAAEPYTRFVENDQYLYQLFLVGQGEYDVSDMSFSDTPLAEFSEIDTEVFLPGAVVSADYNATVHAVSEVSGQELEPYADDYTPISGPPFPGLEWQGFFNVNNSGTVIDRIEIDLVFPQGFYAMSSTTGAIASRTATVVAEAQEINDAGADVGGPIYKQFIIRSAGGRDNISTSPQRYTRVFDVPEGRYKIKVAKNNNYSIVDDGFTVIATLNWAGCRGYVVDESTIYGDYTLIGIKARATNQLANNVAQRFNCVVEKHVDAWNGTTWTNGISRNPAWAIADICKASYGWGLSDSQIDLAGLLVLANTWDSRGDYFDGGFDSKTNCWEALVKVASAGRAAPVRQAGILRIVRDDAKTTPVALYSGRNIAAGSFKVSYGLPNPQTPSKIRVRYKDAADDYKENTLTDTATIYPGGEIKDVTFFGITTRQHAWREMKYLTAAAKYRRVRVSFETDIEGYIPTYGDLVAVNHDLVGGVEKHYSGDVVGVSGDTLTLSVPVDVFTGTWEMTFSDEMGGIEETVTVTPGANEYEVDVSPSLSFTPYTGQDKEKTKFSIGLANYWAAYVKVMSIKPSGDKIEISGVVENGLMHTVDTGTPPAANYPTRPPFNSWAPIITGLDVVRRGTYTNPILSLSWTQAANADRYLLQTSTDGAEWTESIQVFDNEYEIDVEPGLIWVRVAGLGLLVGEWISWNGDTTTVDVPFLGLGEVLPPATMPAPTVVFNVPATDLKTFSTVEFTVTPPTVADPDFSHAIIQGRWDSEPEFRDIGIIVDFDATPNAKATVVNLGATFHYRAVSVSIAGVVGTSGPEQSVAVSANGVINVWSSVGGPGRPSDYTSNGENLIKDGTLFHIVEGNDSDLDITTDANGWGPVSSGPSYGGESQACLLLTDYAGTQKGIYRKELIPVKTGDKFFGAFRAYRANEDLDGTSVWLSMRYYDAAGAATADYVLGVVGGSDDFDSNVGAWNATAATFEIVKNHPYVQFSIQGKSFDSGNLPYVDDLYLSRVERNADVTANNPANGVLADTITAVAVQDYEFSDFLEVESSTDISIVSGVEKEITTIAITNPHPTAARKATVYCQLYCYVTNGALGSYTSGGLKIRLCDDSDDSLIEEILANTMSGYFTASVSYSAVGQHRGLQICKFIDEVPADTTKTYAIKAYFTDAVNGAEKIGIDVRDHKIVARLSAK